MAYFDSSKNRALWEIRLAQLRKERDAREAGESQGPVRRPEEPSMAGPVRIPISYQELLRQEAMEAGKRQTKDRARERAKEKVQQAAEPSKERQAGL